MTNVGLDVAGEFAETGFSASGWTGSATVQPRSLRRMLQQPGVILKAIKFLLVFVLLVVLAISAFVGWVYYKSWYVGTWDQKIDALCAANGGANVATRVYETAVAPETKEYFRGAKPYTSIGVVERSSGEVLGPEYPFVIESRIVEVIKEKDPIVVKTTVRLVRVSDNKILAERFGYRRSGGGFVILDGTDGYGCPTLTTRDWLEARVFTNHPRYQSSESK